MQHDISWSNIITSAIAVVFSWIVVVLITIIGFIHDKISYKTTFKEYLSERKYFVLFYLYSYLIIIIMEIMMFFEIWGMFAGVLILTIAAGIINQIKNTVVFYIEETTQYKCECGKDICEVIKIKASGERKTLYYVCRSCGKKYREKN